MKRYKCIYPGTKHELQEKVLVPKKTVDIIVKKVLSKKRNILNNDVDGNGIANILNNALKEFNITFSYAEVLSPNTFIGRAQYNPHTLNISFLLLKDVEKICIDEGIFNSFVLNFKEVVSHELVHKMQNLKFKTTKIKNKYKGRVLKNYLACPREIMAFALQITEWLLIEKGSVKEVENFLKYSDIDDRAICEPLKEYHRYFSFKDKELKLLYKYIFQYLDEY